MAESARVEIKSMMANEKQARGTIAVLGAAAVAVVAVLLGVLYWTRPAEPPAQNATQQSAPQTSAPQAPAAAVETAAKPAPAPEPPAASREGDLVPSFDVVRVEPDGESVIAG